MSMNDKAFDEREDTKPTYEWLYEYWLATKDRYKKKPKQLKGQQDLFDVVDKTEQND